MPIANFVIKKSIGDKVKVKINARRSMDNKIMIYDHPRYDVIIDVENQLVSLAPKEIYDDNCYNSQKKLMNYLRRRGAIENSSIQSGEAFGFLEATLAGSEEFGDSTQAVVYLTARHFEDELPKMKFVYAYKDSIDSFFTEPNAEDSTELGEVPHSKEQGTLSTIVSPFGTPYRAYEE